MMNYRLVFAKLTWFLFLESYILVLFVYFFLMHYQLTNLHNNLENEVSALKHKLEVKDELTTIVHFLEQSAIIAYTNEAGIITDVNNKYLEISGYPKDEIVGQNNRIMNSGHHSKEFFKHMWTQIQSGESWNGEIKNRAKDGSFYWVQTIIHPIRNRSGKIVKYLSVKFDVTDAKKNEVKLLEQQDQLIESAQMATLGEMAGGIAHEINNPVSIIRGKTVGVLKRLKDKSFTSEKGIQDLERVIFAADRIVKIVNGLRTFSRNGESDPFEKTEIKGFIAEIISLCEEKFRVHSVKIQVMPLPDLTFECRIVQLGQVILNLLNNSYDAVVDLPAKWVRIEVTQKIGKVEISLTDSGSGIPIEIAEKIMQPFFTTKRVGKGTGLGLSLSKAIIEEHSGTLSIDHSCPNTRFLIEIPIQHSDQSAQNAA